MTSSKLLPRLTLIVRLLLFLVFITYGTVKLSGGQYDYSNWDISKQTSDGPGVVWAFYGYSPVYGRFTGLFEAVPALMLLSRRTATLGAMALFAVGVNITVMDFCYHYPEVKYFILAYTLLSLFVVVQDRKRLKSVFWDLPKRETTGTPDTTEKADTPDTPSGEPVNDATAEAPGA